MASNVHPDTHPSHAMFAGAVPSAASKLIKALSLHVDMPDLAFNDQDVCPFNLGEYLVTIAMDRTGTALVLRCVVLDTPEDADEQFLARLLVGNYSTAYARMGALAIDAESKKIVLLERLPLAGLFPEDLRQAIERIAYGAGFWQQELAENTSPETR